MDEDFQIPVYATDLIDKLDSMFPPRTPSLKESERSIFEYAGRRNLIEMLQEVKRQEQMESLDPTEDVIK